MSAVRKSRCHLLSRVALAAPLMALALIAGTSAVAEAAPPTPGSYTGNIPNDIGGLTFYVSSDSSHVQEAYMPSVALECTGEGSSSAKDHLAATEVPIEASGSFTQTTTQKGVLAGLSVVFTYTFSGQFTGNSATGSYREEITYEGSSRKCTTKTQSWSATRDTQPTQTTEPPTPGSYTGNIPNDIGGLTFYVSSGSSDMQEVYLPSVSLECMGEGETSTTDHLEAAELAIAGGSSFSTVKTQTGILGGRAVVFTYTFSGHFHGTASSGESRAAGTYREDISFEGSTRKCTTNNQSWSAVRNTQPTQTTEPPTPGSYTGNIPNDIGGLTLYVSSNSKQVQDVYLPSVSLECMGEGVATAKDHLESGELKVKTGMSFTTTKKATQKGILAGHAVVFTYTFSGHFHGTASSGESRAAGTYREDISFEGSTRRCTTNSQSWSAVRDTQPTQTTEPPTPGSYTGNIPNDIGGMSFQVSTSSKDLQVIRIPSTGLECMGEGSASAKDHLEIAEVAIKSKSKFKTSVSKKEMLEGLHAVVTYTFSGHFHGTNSSGKSRAAGSFREDISFEGSTRKCTTNAQSWSATHS